MALNDVTLLVKQLDTVQLKLKAPVHHDTPHTPSKQPKTLPAHFMKPVNHNKFADDHDKGHAFLNLCNLYFALAPHRFTNDEARILWALSFMKSDCAALFINCTLRTYYVMGTLPYESKEEFSTIFVTEFFPKNEVQGARTILESLDYFQESRNVEEYIDDFHNLVQCGLNLQIQDDIACLIVAHPSDKSPKEWYDTAILYDENCTVNKAFMSMQREPHPPENPLQLVEQCEPSSLQSLTPL